jgi:hypothetical protein
MATLPVSYTSSTASVANLSTAFWAHRAVFNRVQAMFDLMIKDVEALQAQLEGASETLQARLDASYHGGPADMLAVTKAYSDNADAVVAAFAELDGTLLSHYPDGYCNGCGHGLSHHIGYPAWWLKAVNYSAGPPPTPAPPALAHGGRSSHEGDSHTDSMVSAASCTQSKCLLLRDQPLEMRDCVLECYSNMAEI